jgi:drug/metabolite transporter (DMT)-like permease
MIEQALTAIDWTTEPRNLYEPIGYTLAAGGKRIRPTLVSMYSYVQPIIAIIISIWVGMDTLSWQKVLAAAMVFGGVVLVNYSRSAKSA